MLWSRKHHPASVRGPAPPPRLGRRSWSAAKGRRPSQHAAPLAGPARSRRTAARVSFGISEDRAESRKRPRQKPGSCAAKQPAIRSTAQISPSLIRPLSQPRLDPVSHLTRSALATAASAAEILSVSSCCCPSTRDRRPSRSSLTRACVQAADTHADLRGFKAWHIK